MLPPQRFALAEEAAGASPSPTKEGLRSKTVLSSAVVCYRARGLGLRLSYGWSKPQPYGRGASCECDFVHCGCLWQSKRFCLRFSYGWSKPPPQRVASAEEAAGASPSPTEEGLPALLINVERLRIILVDDYYYTH